MQYIIFAYSAFVGFATAMTAADLSKNATGNPITAPLLESIPAGKPFAITWTVTTPGQVSLELLKGPSSNAIPIKAIVDSIDNNGSYTWTPDMDLEPTTTREGYGIRLVVEGSGQYQYSTQFGISKADGNVSVQSSAGSSAPAPGSTGVSNPNGTVSLSGIPTSILSAGTAGGPHSSSSSGLAGSNSAQLSGIAAAIAGLLSYCIL